MKLAPLFTWLILFTVITCKIEADPKVGIITASNYVGDREVAWRIKIAGERLGWTVFLDEDQGKQIKDLPLDYVICMLPDCQNFNPSCPNYLMVFHPFKYLDDKRKLKPFYKKYDGFLLTINDREIWQDPFTLINRAFDFISFYPSVYNIHYKKLELNNLVVMIPVWSNRLTEYKFKELYGLLSQSGLAKFYGVNRHEKLISNGYMGSIPFDGVSVIDILQQHGIVLVFHSNIHNSEGIPSSRIFEAAAASTVIISDENPFVKKHFGDTVFYIDTALTGRSIFKQIQQHLTTIHENPALALEMAEKAHQIFVENFTMEKQLMELEALHQKVILKRINK